MTVIWSIASIIALLWGAAYLAWWGQQIGFGAFGDAVTYLIVGEWALVVTVLYFVGGAVALLVDLMAEMLFSTSQGNKLPMLRGIFGVLDFGIGAFLTWLWFIGMARIEDLFSVTHPIPDALPVVVGVIMALLYILYSLGILSGMLPVVGNRIESD